MENRKKIEKLAHEAVQKAAEALRNADEALAEANVALRMMQDLSDDELDNISGAGGSSAFADLPRVKTYNLDDKVREEYTVPRR